MSDPRPGIDHLCVGDECVVIEKLHRGEDRITPVRITKANRVWWEFEEIVTDATRRRWVRTWKMRKETQREGDHRGSHYGAEFATAEQLAWDDRQHAADQYLRGIRIHWWECLIPRDRLDKVDLANMILRHLGLEEI